MTKPRWILATGMWWLDAVIGGVDKPALHVAELTPGTFEIHVVKGAQSPRFVRWTGTEYTARNTPEATRAIADEIWAYITSTYDVVAATSYAYNGIAAYDSEWPNRGQLGID